MLWIAAALFPLGVIFGLTLRISAFLAMLFVSSLALLGNDHFRNVGLGQTVLEEIAALVLLQLGYVLGIGLRTLAHSFRNRKRLTAKPRLTRRLRRHQP